MEAKDVAFLLGAVVGATSHSTGGDAVLKAKQAELKAFLADKPDLAVPEVLEPLDKALKYGVLAQVPAANPISGLNPNDYLEPKAEPAAESATEPAAPIEQEPKPEEAPF